MNIVLGILALLIVAVLTYWLISWIVPVVMTLIIVAIAAYFLFRKKRSTS
ncbi:MAG: hypothetical protein OXC80_12005 [Gammaproteobacteria bacterium]|nr:hypothetical protein [Gammaproteobacteria bacterium]